MKDKYNHFMKVRRIEYKIQRLKYRRTALESCLLPPAIRYDKDKVQVTPSDKVSEIVAEIDEIDRKILQIITQNARKPFKDVAEAVGISRAAVHQRVQKMFDNGIITGSGYTVNPKALGYNLCVYVGLTLEKGTMYNTVSEELEKIPEVVESRFTLGTYSMLIKLYARDDMHLMDLLSNKIQGIHGVANTETLTALDQRIHRTLPIK